MLRVRGLWFHKNTVVAAHRLRQPTSRARGRNLAQQTSQSYLMPEMTRPHSGGEPPCCPSFPCPKVGIPFVLWPVFTQISEEIPSQTLWRGPPSSCPSPSSAVCPLLYRTENFRGRGKSEKVPREGMQEGWPAKAAKRKKGRVKTGQY